MSPLPKRKKSAGEIAKLRESLGVPAPSAEMDAMPAEAATDTLVDTGHEALLDRPAPATPLEPMPAPGGGPAHSLKRSERQALQSAPPAASEPPPPAPARNAKTVRSLRKSEQQPLPATSHPEPPPDSKLPLYRHSADEIADLRRREVLSLMQAAPNARLQPAHPALIIPGYLLVLAGAIGCWFYQFPPAATAAFAAAALGVAAFIKRRKPVSVHHAAFISVAALFLVIFSALHYFPLLRHAT